MNVNKWRVSRFNRDWRYHKEERVWITRAPGMEPTLKTNAYERGTYYFFDCLNWRKVAKVNTDVYLTLLTNERVSRNHFEQSSPSPFPLVASRVSSFSSVSLTFI